MKRNRMLSRLSFSALIAAHLVFPIRCLAQDAAPPSEPAPMEAAEPGVLAAFANTSVLLLHREDVRKELALSPAQAQDMNVLLKTVDADMNKRMRTPYADIDWKNMTQSQIEQKLREARSQPRPSLLDFWKGADNKIAKILDARQSVRLKELEYQWRTPLALNDPLAADKVGLTPEQRSQIGEAYHTYVVEMTSLYQSGMGNVRELYTGKDGAPPPRREERIRIEQRRLLESRDRVSRLRNATGEKILEMLTAGQQAKWKSLTGKKFVFHSEGQ